MPDHSNGDHQVEWQTSTRMTVDWPNYRIHRRRHTVRGPLHGLVSAIRTEWDLSSMYSRVNVEQFSAWSLFARVVVCLRWISTDPNDDDPTVWVKLRNYHERTEYDRSTGHRRFWPVYERSMGDERRPWGSNSLRLAQIMEHIRGDGSFKIRIDPRTITPMECSEELKTLR